MDNELLKTLWAYCRAVFGHWWVITIEGVLVSLDVVERTFGTWLLPPLWVKVTIGVAVLVIAQFLAYRNKPPENSTDLDAKLKEQAIRQNELAEQTSLCREFVLRCVNQAKVKHGQNSVAFTEDQLNAWASPYSHRLHAVLDALRTEGRARTTSPGYWLIN
ncbi:MAG: hypothetical protein WAN65_12850 [Candidatus Sulfotelmatobacter sp.]